MNQYSQLSLSFEYEAFIPCYNEIGNVVKAVRKDGKIDLINNSIKCVMRKNMKERSIDLKSLRKNFSVCIERRNIIPIPLGVDTVLIPAKVRQNMVSSNDGAYAYINLDSIKSISGEKAAKITLKSGVCIDCLESIRTITGRIKTGNIMQDKFASSIMGEYGIKKGIGELNSEYSKAATKGDMVLLTYEIMKLEKKFEK